jgi:glycosyltransferase involved in cell wall biosynthesis
VTRRLRIGIDARLAGRGLGIAQFILNLTKEIAPFADVIWFGDPRIAPEWVASVRSLNALPYPALDSPYGRFLVANEEVDLFHFAGNTGWTARGPIPFVLTLHDVIFLTSGVQQRTLRQIVGHRYARWNLPRTLRSASAVVTVSQTSAREIDRLFPYVHVSVILNASDMPHVAAMHGKSFESALVFASRDPRKGLELAYRAWVKAGRVPPQLKVLGGAGVPERFRKLAADDLKSERVILLPYVSRELLKESIRRAGVLIYPSSEEGFGLPVLDAMTLGTPVITGLAPVTLEIGGDAIARIDPGDPVPSIAGLLRRLAVNTQWRAHLVRAGRHRASQFSWAKSAQHYISIYETLLSGEHGRRIAAVDR